MSVYFKLVHSVSFHCICRLKRAVNSPTNTVCPIFRPFFQEGKLLVQLRMVKSHLQFTEKFGFVDLETEPQWNIVMVYTQEYYRSFICILHDFWILPIKQCDLTIHRQISETHKSVFPLSASKGNRSELLSILPVER